MPVFCGNSYYNKAKWLILGDVRDGCSKLSTVTESFHDFVSGIANDDANLGDAGVDHRFDSIKQDRFISDRHQLLCPSMGNRAKSGSGAASKNKSLHSCEG